MALKKTKNSEVNFKAGDALWGNVFGDDHNETQSALSVLKKVPLFRTLSKSELKEVTRIMHRRQYDFDEPIFHEGEPGVGMYIVLDGVISISKGTKDSVQDELAELARGEFFGELALLDESPRSATAISKDKSKVIGLFRPDLLDLIDRKPRLGNKLLFELAHLIGERLKHTNDELQAVWAKIDESKVIT